MTDAIYLEVSEKTEAARKAGRRVSVSGMLKISGVSRSGYLAWLHHVPSDTEKRREAVKAKMPSMFRPTGVLQAMRRRKNLSGQETLQCSKECRCRRYLPVILSSRLTSVK